MEEYFHSEKNKENRDGIQTGQKSSSKQGKKKVLEGNDTRSYANRQPCAVCGLKNHSTDDCRRKLYCELCQSYNSGL